jgi:diaminopimelate epimerase
MLRFLVVLPVITAFITLPHYSGSRRSHNTGLHAQSFSKYQGLGNDFILINNLGSNEPIYTPEQSARLCDRNFGIGADGVIFALPGVDGCDYTMRIYNSDGSEPQMCGNGIRCMARFLMEIEGKDSMNEVTYSISTGAGKIIPKISLGDSITVDMGKPTLIAEKVPTTLAATKDGAAVNAPISASGANYEVTCVSMGNPHAVSSSIHGI